MAWEKKYEYYIMKLRIMLIYLLLFLSISEYQLSRE